MTEPARQIGRPEVGFWMVKLAKHAVEVPARIFWCDHEPGVPDNKVDQPYLDAEAAGERVGPEDIWHRRGRRITAQKFAYQIALHQWIKKNEPAHPAADPRKPIDLMKAPVPW